MTSHNSQPSLSDILKLDPTRAAKFKLNDDDGSRATRELSSPPIALPDVDQLRKRDRQQIAQLREALHQEQQAQRALGRYLSELRDEVSELRLAGAQYKQLALTVEVVRRERDELESKLRQAYVQVRQYRQAEQNTKALKEQTEQFRAEIVHLRQEMENHDELAAKLAAEHRMRTTAERLLRLTENRAEALQARVDELERARSRLLRNRMRGWLRRLLGLQPAKGVR